MSSSKFPINAFRAFDRFNCGAIKLKRSSGSAEESGEGAGMRASAAAPNSELAIGKFPERLQPANRGSAGLGNSTRSLQNPCAESGVGAACCEESFGDSKSKSQKLCVVDRNLNLCPL